MRILPSAQALMTRRKRRATWRTSLEGNRVMGSTHLPANHSDVSAVREFGVWLEGGCSWLSLRCLPSFCDSGCKPLTLKTQLYSLPSLCSYCSYNLVTAPQSRKTKGLMSRFFFFFGQVYRWLCFSLTIWFLAIRHLQMSCSELFDILNLLKSSIII